MPSAITVVPMLADITLNYFNDRCIARSQGPASHVFITVDQHKLNYSCVCVCGIIFISEGRLEPLHTLRQTKERLIGDTNDVRPIPITGTWQQDAGL